jgi:hypothetical protein
MNEDELVNNTPLDQNICVDIEEYKGDNIDAAIETSVLHKDLDIAIGACFDMISKIKLSGILLAKALYLIKKNWDVYEIGDSFVDCVSARLGIHTHTVTRYCDIWEMFKTAPQEHVPSLQEHTMNSLIPIANALAQGHEITNETWDKLADAPDAYTVKNILREEVTHAEPRKNSLSLVIDRKGSIYAWSENVCYYIGFLDVGADDEITIKAITRIIKNSGIMQQ